MTPAVRPRRRCRVARHTGVGREGEPAICAVHTAAAATKERFGRTFLLAPLLKGKEAPSERNSIRNWRGETGRERGATTRQELLKEARGFCRRMGNSP